MGQDSASFESEAVPSDGGPLAYVADLHDPTLNDEDHHHLARVRRLRPGDDLILGDAAGHWCRAHFDGNRPALVGPIVAAPKLQPELEVAFALVKGAKPELVVQKLTELGIDRIRPFVASRSVVRWDGTKSATAHARLVKVARGAAMQSRRAWIPRVEAVATFAEVSTLAGACRADRGGDPPSLERPVLLVGPEGGWDDQERSVDLPVVGLGDGVLRAETAAITAGVVLSVLRCGLVRSTT